MCLDRPRIVGTCPTYCSNAAHGLTLGYRPAVPFRTGKCCVISRAGLRPQVCHITHLLRNLSTCSVGVYKISRHHKHLHCRSNMSDKVIKFPASGHARDEHRLLAFRIIDRILDAEKNGEFWKADALFVRLARKTGRSELLDGVKANSAVAAARICSAVGCHGS